MKRRGKEVNIETLEVNRLRLVDIALTEPPHWWHFLTFDGPVALPGQIPRYASYSVR